MKGVISVQSHVVYGHAGNSSAVFPLQRMGLEVWPIHTVQFSNHTQYSEGWRGKAFPAPDIEELITGLSNIKALEQCSAVITGYQGNVEQCEVIVRLVEQVRQHNPEALYVCDPVMGSPTKGCIVSEGIQECLINQLMPMADIIVPNQYELSQFVNIEINDLKDAVNACQAALKKGPKIVLVKHLHSLVESKDKFTMMLAFDDQCYLVHRPNLDFDKALVGVGDLISAIFTGGLLKGWSAVKAFKHCNEATYAVVKQTKQSEEWELQTIQAQDELVTPKETFPVGEYINMNHWEWHDSP